MPIIDVDLLPDARLSWFLDLTDVRLRTLFEPDAGIFIAEGRLVIERALSAGLEPLAAVADAKWCGSAVELLPADVPVYRLPDEMLAELTGFRVHRGALAAFRRPAAIDVDSLAARSRRLVVLEDLVNHTNVGAIARSAAAFGFDGMVVSPGSADPLYRRALRTSMGATLALPFARARSWPDDLKLLRDADFELIGLSPSAAVPLTSDAPGERVALVLGTEGSGLSPAMEALLDRAVRIPTTDRVDSLNVAVAAGIACHYYGLTRT